VIYQRPIGDCKYMQERQRELFQDIRIEPLILPELGILAFRLEDFQD